MAPRKPKPATEPAPTRRSAETIEQWPIERFRAYMRNSRTHSSDQIKKIAASIERFGFTNPILAAEDGTIIAGHGRVMAARLLKLKTLPVIVATGWTDDERKAYVIADNKIALEGGWDEEMLRLELGELADANFDLTLTGFDEASLNDLFGKQDEKPPGDTSPQLSGLSYSVIIRCTDEAQQTELLESLGKQGLICEALIS